MSLEFDFEVPKHNLKKLGKIFDLDSMDLDDYYLILLSTVDAINLQNLDKFDASLSAYESTTSGYTRTRVPLQVTETTTGYQISVSGSNVTVPISNATIEGVLIVKNDTMDILAAALNASSVTYGSDVNIVFTTVIWDLANQVDPA